MAEPAAPLPLAGLRVFELSIAIAAPNCGRYLAHYGAEVFKVESPKNPDVARLFASSWARGRPELAPVLLDTSPYCSEMSAGKLSIALDLKHPRGLEAGRMLIAACDIFLTNYSAPAVRALGLDYESVRAMRPDIVYVALPGFGSDPSLPYYNYLAWGPNQAPLVGLDNLTGFPDQPPCGVAAIAPPDYCSSLHGTVAVLAALEHRDATGEGTFVDVSQFEATVALLGPYVFEHSLTGRVQDRTGNRGPGAAPEGVYPSRGDDAWLAITVTADAEWAALGRVAGSPAWAADARFATHDARLKHLDEIDELLAAWTASYTASELAAWLQEAGVPAYPVLDNFSLVADPQVRDRRFYQVRRSSRFGRDLFTGHPMHFSETPGDVDRAGPILGEDTEPVLRDVCGYGDDEIASLIEAQAAFGPPLPELVLTRPYDGDLPAFIPGLGREDRRNR